MAMKSRSLLIAFRGAMKNLLFSRKPHYTVMHQEQEPIDLNVLPYSLLTLIQQMSLLSPANPSRIMTWTSNKIMIISSSSAWTALVVQLFPFFLSFSLSSVWNVLNEWQSYYPHIIIIIQWKMEWWIQLFTRSSWRYVHIKRPASRNVHKIAQEEAQQQQETFFLCQY